MSHVYGTLKEGAASRNAVLTEADLFLSARVEVYTSENKITSADLDADGNVSTAGQGKVTKYLGTLRTQTFDISNPYRRTDFPFDRIYPTGIPNITLSFSIASDKLGLSTMAGRADAGTNIILDVFIYQLKLTDGKGGTSSAFLYGKIPTMTTVRGASEDTYDISGILVCYNRQSPTLVVK